MSMTIHESLLVALFMMSVVFVVLISLWAVIRIFGAIITRVEKARSLSGTGVKSGQQG